MRGFLWAFGQFDSLQSAFSRGRLGQSLVSLNPPQPLGSGQWVVSATIDTCATPFRMRAAPFAGVSISGRIYGLAGHSTAGLDAESILRLAFQSDGRDAQAKLNGEYCFCLVDPTSGAVHASVDLFGVRSLYYLQMQGIWAVSDSCSALLALFGSQLSLNGLAIASALVPFSEPCSERGETFYSDLRVLRAGEWLRVDLRTGQADTSRIGLPAHLTEFDHYSARQLDDALRDALNAALVDRIAHENAVLTLSGGIDSALLATQLADLRKARPGMQIHALTSVLRGDSGEDEAYHAELTARALEIDLQRTIRDPGPVRFPVASLVPWAEHPMALYDDLSQVRALMALGSPSISGLGADELVATSLRRPGRRRGWFARLRRRIARFRSGPASMPAPECPDLTRLTQDRTPAWIPARWHDALPQPGLEAAPGGGDQHAWHELLLPNAGFCTDVEARDDVGMLRADVSLPYLDQRVVRVVLNPAVAQLDLDRAPASPAKQALRRLLHGRVPEAVTGRRKSPAGQPFFARYSGPELAQLPAALAQVPRIGEFLRPDQLPSPVVDSPWSTLYPLIAGVSVGSWLHHHSGVERQWTATTAR